MPGSRVIVVGDERRTALAALAGCPARVDLPSTVRNVDAVVLVTPEDPYPRVRAWRAAGHRFGVVVWAPSSPDPDDRALLEPLVVVRTHADPSELTEALRGLKGRDHKAIVLSNGVIDLVRRVFVKTDGSITSLSHQEVDLLAYLAARQGREVSREELRRQVWGHRRITSSRAVDMAISRLRKKVEATPSQPEHLLTCRGDGYALTLAGTAPSPHGATPSGSLQLQPVRMWGRDEVLEELLHLTGAGGSLVTLVGPPGVGKTTLAAQVALSPKHGRGVIACDLVPVSDQGELLLHLARALDIETDPRSDLAELRQHIGRSVGRRFGGRGPLVLLDNAEHLVDAVAAELGDLSAWPSDTCILVTSQAVLGLPEERIVAVSPLAAEDAVAMLQARCAFKGARDLADTDLRPLAEMLEGLPLALDLAASRVRVMGVRAVVAALQRGLEVLRDPRRATTHPRHATLERALELAWARLSTDQQRVLTELAVAPAGLPWSGAMATCQGSHALEETLEALVDASLVQLSAERIRVIAPIRRFVLARGSGAVAARAAAAHAAWAHLEARDHLDGIEASAASRHALRELSADIRAALDWACANQAPELLLHLTRALVAVRRGRAHADAALDLVQRALAATPQAMLGLRSDLLRQQGTVHADSGNHRRATEVFEIALALARQHGGDVRIGRLLLDLAHQHGELGDVSQALTHVRRARPLLAGILPDEELARACELNWAAFARDPGLGADPVAELRASNQRLVDRGLLASAVSVQVTLCNLVTNSGQRAMARVERERLGVLVERAGIGRLKGVVDFHQILELFHDEAFEEVLTRSQPLGARLADLHLLVFARHLTLYRGLALAHLQRREEALELLARARAEHLATGMPRDAAHEIEGMAHVQLDEGDLVGAIASIQEARALAAACGDHTLIDDIELLGAAVALFEGDLETSASTLDAIDHGALPDDHAVTVLGLRAAIAARQGEPPDAWLADADRRLRRPDGIAFVASLTAWRRSVPDGPPVWPAALATMQARLLVRAWNADARPGSVSWHGGVRDP